MERDFSLAFERFRQDRSAQYEMHPKFGRYVWDIHDQWYQKWNVILSLEHAWNWTLHRLDTMLLEEDPYTVDSLIPYLDLLARKHHIHPHHQDLLKRICGYLLSWQKSNKMLSNAGTMRLNTIPFFPPSWFSEKEELKTHMEVGDRLASSYFARFVPPYRQKDAKIPERWDVVFLKGLTYDPTNEKFDVDPSLIASTIPLYGLTVHMDQRTGYSYVMMVMRKATLGNLENSLQQMIPVDYQKPQRLALSITKAIKDLHWEYIHGNVHPRNILFNFDDSIGELVDATFMQRKPPSSSVIPSPSTITHHHRHSHHLHHPYPTTTTATPAPTPPTSPQDDPASSSAHSPFCLPTSSHSLQPSHLASPYPTSVMPYHAHVNRKGGMSGRWPYVSPEVAQGITGPTTEADVYALGVILWQLISRLTFPANAPVDPWVFRIEPIPGILPEWEKLYKDCLQADPARRPSAYTVYRRLEKMPITYVTDTGATRLLPIHQHTIQYIQQRQKEIEDFLRIHENTFSQPEHRLTQLQNDVILTASITRSINHGLASYPSPVFLFRDDRSSQATSPPPPLP
ncbi:kinase-like protein [Hesseltinella vesiculosa]|uniref:Kinase-like protein n=1 Tax=Hesseltinella vesiculosa TaxID=101127 RepID=A0A1X2GJ28_9FUNG|nr:kinase-like protein [Hesseltinella vesiculosa]